ncbi:hypothetical protein Pmani_007487 [Petrolisthes manimaculis]|uniref:Conserved oligomeric Golgi complex subunit 1 n=1 Tax=Petrolisthes manimaculis TaxID=1843537 RepID=A0AAE1Q8I1_9EUCA|nr:hypothetical protein Pmani_007487 [Petrolisthes manimaculis]
MASSNSSVFSWEQLVDKFMMDIQIKNPEKMQEMMTKIGPDQSNEDMFSFIWNMEETHRILTPNTVLRPPNTIKSNAEADKNKVMGDKHLKLGDYDKALMCYNMCLRFALHPPITLTDGNRNQLYPDKKSSSGKNNVSVRAKNSTGWGKYGALARGYYARALLLFKMKQYDLCIRDTELTLELGCPVAIRKELSHLRSTCLHHKAKSELTIGLYDGKGKDAFACLCPSPPRLEEINLNMPSLSAAVKLTYSTSQGRHLVAARDIHPGELLGVEASYVSSLHAAHTSNFCIVCLKRCGALLPCHTCNKVGYCSDECRKEGMMSHWQECPVLPIFHNIDMGDNPVRAYKVMMKVGYTALKNSLPQLQSEAINKSPKDLGFNSEGAIYGTDYSSVFHLITNKDKRPRSDILKRCLQAFIVTKLLVKSKRYFITNDGVAFTPSQEDLVMTGSTLIHHLMSFTCNTDSINELKVITDDYSKNPVEAFGGGLFPTMCLFNHSCNQSCFKTSYGHVIAVRSARFIPVGGPLTVSYGCRYDMHSVWTRKQFLLEQFHFFCTCEACDNMWRVSHELPTIKLKCVQCLETVDPGRKKCTPCNIEYIKCVPVSGSPNLYTYNYNQIKKMITRAAAEYRQARYNIMEKGSTSSEDKKKVIKMVELICKYMVEPNAFSEASCVLISYYDRLGSIVHYQPQVRHKMANEDEVTLLFEQNSVTQVQDILNKTRNDIERKKEDLRVMVGERYRDLIEAADTIAEMQSSAEAVCENIQTMEGLCGSLQQRGLIGFKTQIIQSNNKDNCAVTGTHYSVAVQVRVLVGAPETLWSLTEQGRHLHASQLLLLALHTHTALNLAPSASQVSSWFPVIERQWINITQFRSTIVRGCSSLISSEVDDIEGIVDAVVSVMLVEGGGMEDALTQVLRLRHSALTAALLPRPSATAKAQISHFTTLFLASLTILHAVFVEESDGRSQVEKRVEEVVSGREEASSPIALLQESSLTLSFLPHSIRTFRPTVQGNTMTLGKELIRKKVGIWLETVLQEASQALTKLLSYTTSIKALAMIRSSVWEVCQERLDLQYWDKVTSEVCGMSLDPWECVVRGVVMDRAKAVVASQLSTAREATVQMLTTLTNDILSNQKVCQEEGDVSGFVWNESNGDLPLHVGWTPAATRPLTQAGGLYHKTRGYTSRLQSICRALNSRLLALLQDVSYFSSESEKKDRLNSSGNEIGIGGGWKSVSEDYHILLTYLQDASCLTFTQMVKELEEVAGSHFINPEKSNNFDEDLSHHPFTCGHPLPPSVVVVVVAWRLCLALTNVCHQMQLCTSAASLTNPDFARRASAGSKIETEAWAGVRTSLTEAGCRLFRLLLGSLTTSLNKELKEALKGQLSAHLQTSLTIFPTWEVVEIEEEGEGGRVVKSSIHVPAHPTPTLTRALTHYCLSLNKLAAHTIARGNQSIASDGGCEAVVSAYQSVLTDSTTITQTLALQLIFDLRFIQTLLLPRDNKVTGGQVAAMVHTLEGNVDPFDLDVFSPHLSSRVRQAAHRAQVLLGAILPRDRLSQASRTPSQTSPSTAISNNNALPIILAMEIPRFSNVPLPTSSKSSTSSLPTTNPNSLPNSVSAPSLAGMAAGLGEQTLKKHTSSKESSPAVGKREMSAAALSASRSAASLFSAMSSSWFGSSSTS